MQKTYNPEIARIAARYMTAHKRAYEEWTYGLIKKTWFDSRGNLCNEYTDGTRFHYRVTRSGLQWWQEGGQNEKKDKMFSES